jgi:ATP adenylyltransferase
LLSAYLRAPASAAPFIAIIVKVPVVQIASMILGMIMLVVEYPLPQIKEFAIYRSLAMRVVFLLIQVILNILYYQVSTRFMGITTFPA